MVLSYCSSCRRKHRPGGSFRRKCGLGCAKRVNWWCPSNGLASIFLLDNCYPWDSRYRRESVPSPLHRRATGGASARGSPPRQPGRVDAGGQPACTKLGGQPQDGYRSDEATGARGNAPGTRTTPPQPDCAADGCCGGPPAAGGNPGLRSAGANRNRIATSVGRRGPYRVFRRKIPAGVGDGCAAGLAVGGEDRGRRVGHLCGFTRGARVVCGAARADLRAVRAAGARATCGCRAEPPVGLSRRGAPSARTRPPAHCDVGAPGTAGGRAGKHRAGDPRRDSGARHCHRVLQPAGVGRQSRGVSSLARRFVSGDTAQRVDPRRNIPVRRGAAASCPTGHPGTTTRLAGLHRPRSDLRLVLRRVVRWAGNVARGKADGRQSFTKAEFVDGGTVGPARG